MYSLSDRYLIKMRKFVGKKIIRIAPTKSGDFCFREKIVNLDSINGGEIRISWDKGASHARFNRASDYLDENWVPLEEVMAAPHPTLSALEGRYVKRIPESDISFSRGVDGFEKDTYKLLKACESHLFIEKRHENGRKEMIILCKDRIVFNNWILDPEFAD